MERNVQKYIDRYNRMFGGVHPKKQGGCIYYEDIKQLDQLALVNREFGYTTAAILAAIKFGFILGYDRGKRELTT